MSKKEFLFTFTILPQTFMLMERKFICWLILSVLWCQALIAQSPSVNLPDSNSITTAHPQFIVGDIIITGNKKTKTQIILREIPFQSGESYELKDLVKKFEDARRQLLNTSLFHSVVVAASRYEGNTIHVTVELKERWYLFPLPYFKPVDRNLNQWLVEQKASLSRVNYGVKLMYNNATGRNDKFNFLLMSGYTRQFSLSYNRTFIDKKLKWGMGASFGMGKYREVNHNTINDKQVFLKDDNNYIRSFVRANVAVTYRKAIKTRHVFGLSYSSEKIGDTVLAMNPYYFNNGRKDINFPTIYYGMDYYDFDYNPYPTKGYGAQLSLSKSGFDQMVNLWQLTAKAMGSWHLSPKIFFSLNVAGGIKLPLKQPYFSRRFLGYGDMFLQGYEYYVIDGSAGGFVKATVNRRLFDFSIRIPPRKKGAEPDRIPIKIFAKLYGNTGYVHNPEPGENILSNKMLYSGGIGIDIVTFYDITFKIEWSFNQLGQNGIFLHRRSIF